MATQMNLFFITSPWGLLEQIFLDWMPYCHPFNIVKALKWKLS